MFCGLNRRGYTPSGSDVYYKYDYSGGENEFLEVGFYNRDILRPERVWQVEFNDAGEAVKYYAGCASGCGAGSGEFESLEYYDAAGLGDDRYDGLIKRRFNAASDIIAEYEYTTEIAGLTDEAGAEDNVYLTRPLLVREFAVDNPGGGDEAVYEIRQVSYDGNDYSATEYVYVDNEHYRLVKNFFDGPTFTTLAGRAEYAELNADPNDECYVTGFDYDGVTETITYPSGNRQNIKVYNSGHQLRAEYVYDTVHDANSMANAYTYENSYPASHTGPLGGTTEYSYSAAGYLCAELEAGNNLGIDPNTSRLKIFTTSTEWAGR